VVFRDDGHRAAVPVPTRRRPARRVGTEQIRVEQGFARDEQGRRTWTLMLPFTTPLSLNKLIGANRYAACKQLLTWERAGWALATQHRIPRLEAFTVVLHHAPRVYGEGVRDYGNYEGSIKPLVDGLVLAKVAVDDNITRYQPTQPVVHPPTGEPGRLWLVVVDLG
jgi:hypothetical protein